MNSNVKNSFFYFIGYLISRLQAFFLLPILVNFLTKEKLGVYEILTSINVLVIAFSVLNLDSCLLSFYNEQKEIEKKSELTSTAFVFSFVFGFLILLGVYCFREFLLNSLRLSDYVNSFVLFLSVLNGVLGGWTHLTLVLFRLNFQSLKFSLVSVLGPTFSLLLTYGFLKNRNSLEGVIYANVFTSFFTLILSFFLMDKRVFYTRPNLKFWFSRFLKIILPLIPFSFSSWMLNLADREILVTLRGFTDAGIYGVLNKISLLINIFLGPFQMSWTPYAMSRWEQGAVGQTFEKVFRVFFLVSFVIILFVYLTSDFLIKIFSDNSYLEFSYLIAPLAICNVLGAAYYFPLVSFMKKKKMWACALSFLFGAGINIICNFLLVPTYGILGAVLSNVLGYSVMFLVAARLEASITGVGYFYKRVVFFSLLISFALVFFGKSYFLLGGINRLFFAASSFFCTIFIFCLLSGVTKKELIHYSSLLKAIVLARFR